MLKMLDQLSSCSSSNMNVTTNSTVTMEESMQQLHLSNNNDTENDADGYNDPTKVCGLANKDYDYISTHSDLESAKKAIDEGLIANQYWTRGNKYSTKSGDKICYTCRSFVKCPKRMYLLLDTENQDVHAYVSTDNHAHETISKLRLDTVSKQKVLELIDSGVVQPRRILRELEKHNLPRLTKTQINNLKARLKKKSNLYCSLR